MVSNTSVEIRVWRPLGSPQLRGSQELSLTAMYSDGKGVQRDLVEAYKWAAIAGAQKHPEARDFVESLSARMTKSQISAGQSLAREWIQEHPLDPESSQTLDHMVYDTP
jgi:TPR repeat protein